MGLGFKITLSEEELSDWPDNRAGERKRKTSRKNRDKETASCDGHTSIETTPQPAGPHREDVALPMPDGERQGRMGLEGDTSS